MSKLKVAIHGLGNIGKHLMDCLLHTDDMECVGVIRRKESMGKDKELLAGVSEFENIQALIEANSKPDVAILSCPSRSVPEIAPEYLSLGINTVDSFDIHSEINDLLHKLEPIAQKHGVSSIVAAGWDPGTDSIFRAIFEAMTPVGTTFTNFGRGRSMGHSVAARSIEGVANATAITIPLGGGRHSRLVFLLPEKGQDQAKIKKNLASDPYFSKDELEIRFVTNEAELKAVADNSHGVFMERVGASGSVSNQHLEFDMRINNPALTAQVLVSSARAAQRMPKGAFTLIDLPPVFLLAGDRFANIERLV